MPSEKAIIPLEYRVSVPPFLRPDYLSEGIMPSHKVTLSPFNSSGNSTDIKSVEDGSNTVLCKTVL